LCRFINAMPRAIVALLAIGATNALAWEAVGP